MSYYPETNNHVRNKIKVELDLSNYATKADLNRATGVDTFNLAAKSYLASLKAEVDKIIVDKLKTTPSNLVDNVVKKNIYDELFAKVNAIDSSKLVKKTDYNIKIKEIEDKFPNHDKYTTTPEFNKLTK